MSRFTSTTVALSTVSSLVSAMPAFAQTTQPPDTGDIAYPTPLPQGNIATTTIGRPTAPTDTGNMAYPTPMQQGNIGTCTPRCSLGFGPVPIAVEFRTFELTSVIRHWGRRKAIMLISPVGRPQCVPRPFLACRRLSAPGRTGLRLHPRPDDHGSNIKLTVTGSGW